jgi:hypothetical protein
MMHPALRVAAAILVVTIVVAAPACGDSDGANGEADAGPTAPAASCVQPGDEGNENGVGDFCTPGGGECGGLAPLCLADAAPGEEQWFCTRLCSEDEQCGTEARCIGDDRGRACVPERCLGDMPPDDAGADDDAGTNDDAGASDAGADGG